mmetsp:Transcript_1554/g.3660  ORF Transcript_1554/g.3660 Transcript_1554/m.3660 type:complete len:710 (+) Transcript_1554:34-2163(+)
MPAPTIPANSRKGEEPDHEDVRSIEVEMPTSGVAIEMQLETMRKQFESDFLRVLERIQALEGRLDMQHSPVVVGQKMSSNDVEPTKENVLMWDAKEQPVLNMQSGVTETEVEEDEQSTEVYFEESAWSIPVLAGIIDVNVGPFDRMFAGLLVLLNFFMQGAFSWVLLTDAFIGEAFETRVESAKIWRTSVAHDFKYLDLADTSLVSRVCTGDGALILSTTQATLIHQINSFLGLQKEQFDHSVFQPGILLGMICIILWTLCVYKEFRRIWLQMEAAWTIPKKRRTVFRNNAFVCMSWGRFCALLATYLARAIIATVLLAAGILWLARTTSIEELMLNAVALNAILDVDEFLFAGMTPIKIQHAIQSLKPIKVKYSRQRSQCESLVHFVTLSILVLLSYYLLLGPLGDTMLAVKNELCGGDQAFVVAYNSDTQQTFGLKTSETRDYQSLSASEVAVRSHKATSPETTPGSGPAYLTFSANKDLFEADRTRSMAAESALTPFCIEALTDPSNPRFNDPSMQAMTQVRIDIAALSAGRPDADGCQGLGDLCDTFDARLVRLTCGNTCGCLNPYSSAWFKVEAQGCGTACLKVAEMRMLNSTCQDLPPDDNWRKFWTLYPTVLSSFYGRDISGTTFYAEIIQTVNAMISGGCPVLAQSPFELMTQASWCQGMSTLFRPLATVCPQTCGCNLASGELPSYCPPSCARAGNSSFA